MRIFDELAKNVEKHVAQLCLKYDDLELGHGRINGYRVAPAAYFALYNYLLHQADLANKAATKPAYEHVGEIWFNFGGVALNNPSVKQFDVTRCADGTLRLKASLVTIANGTSPFDTLTDEAACCGNHCSVGSYNICPTYE